jgi:uncharacterized membrane protein (UPF0127 family)
MERPQLSLRPTDVTSVPSVENGWSRAVFTALLCFVLSISVAVGLAFALEKQKLTFLTAGGPQTIQVEVADSEEERSTGLMFRRSIGEREGMLFLYDREQDISMWMKNTYIPLDMIFVRRDGVISRIETHTEPFSESIISSQSDVLAVIEVGGGNAGKLGVKPGDRVQHPAFK